jgi:response regulator RpfG family c-di-GMP phosphodiesterase
MPYKILFVDDEPNILAGFKRQLHARFDVTIATSGTQGLEILSLQDEFAVVIADYRMPGMDGVQFLSKVRDIAPDTVRIMLTGYAELLQVIDAVNEGNIFRFLTKPCPPEALDNVINAGVEQYRLINSERELLEKTLSNSIRLLTEMLSLANPVAFSQTLKLRKIVHRISQNLNMIDAWEFELAAMLSQIGCMALPSAVLEKFHAGTPLTTVEESMVASHPLIGYKLLEDIPRIGSIPLMVRDQGKLFGDFDPNAPGRNQKAELGAQIIKIARDYDQLVHKGLSHSDVVRMMKKYTRYYNPKVIRAMGDTEILSNEWQVRMINADEIEIGMVTNENVCSKDGQVVVSRDQEISRLVMERIQLLDKSRGLVEPFRVLVPEKVVKTD